MGRRRPKEARKRGKRRRRYGAIELVLAGFGALILIFAAALVITLFAAR